MDAPRHYKFSVIRYVPDIIREEFINIGVLILDLSDTPPPLVCLTRDWTRLRSLDPNIDIEILQALEEGLISEFQDSMGMASFMETIQGFSNNLQISPFRARAAESMESLAAELMVMYVSLPRKRALFAMAAGA